MQVTIRGANKQTLRVNPNEPAAWASVLVMLCLASPAPASSLPPNPGLQPVPRLSRITHSLRTAQPKGNRPDTAHCTGTALPAGQPSYWYATNPCWGSSVVRHAVTDPQPSLV